jgi:hypothetical protein
MVSVLQKVSNLILRTNALAAEVSSLLLKQAAEIDVWQIIYN